MKKERNRKEKRIKRIKERKLRERNILKNVKLNIIQVRNALNKGKGTRVKLKE